MRCILALLFTLALPASAAKPVQSVPQLDISRYAGEWHEIAHLPMFFQRKCVGDITARYTLDDDGEIGVRNGCRTRDGAIDVAEGTARRVKGHPARLQVRFAPDVLDWVPMVWADYWVIDLDPEYQWAVVGEPDREYFWILSRTPTMERGLFEQITGRAEAMGYDLKRLVVVAQVR